ncbi:MAG TPA: ribonuclease P protein component [Candidatus Woesebacteria bacterium]|nr:ribonuclease P protein component [Candidatus Woesebacteria bacterium]
MALPKSQRLSLRFHRDRLTREGHTSRGHFFTVVSAPFSDQSLSSARFAIIVSKKTASLAVDRNRLKRITTSLLQQLSNSIFPADYMVIPQRQVLQESEQALLADLKKIFSK